MRIILLSSAALALTGSGSSAVTTREAVPAHVAAAPTVLGDDPDGQGAGCVVFLGQAEPARSSYRRASAAWRAFLVRRLGKDGAAQLIGSSVNPLQDTPAAARRAAIHWCAAHAPAAR